MELYRQINSLTTTDTEAAGALFAKEIISDSTLPRFVAMEGDLGVGKTVFVRGFVSAISAGSAVRSPTFTLVNEYRKGEVPIFHFDMYRISDDDELYSMGFYDYLNDRRAISLVEWSENITYAFPKEYFRVRIEKNNPDNTDERLISIYLKKAD